MIIMIIDDHDYHNHERDYDNDHLGPLLVECIEVDVAKMEDWGEHLDKEKIDKLNNLIWFLWN